MSKNAILIHLCCSSYLISSSFANKKQNLLNPFNLKLEKMENQENIKQLHKKN